MSLDLPLQPPLAPQLARARAELPLGDDWCYEPKWDGFRALAFVDGDQSYLQSRNGKDLGRYFPELRFPAGRYVVDGELVILGPDGRQEFDLLQQRIHPAQSRIDKLSIKHPARFVGFDLLALDDKSLLGQPFQKRRAALERIARSPIELTPATDDAKAAERWLEGAEGVVAKQLDAPYLPGERAGMVKIKRVRTIDTVVRGWREGKQEGTLGSLILGLYDGDELQTVGHTSGFKAQQKRELPAMLAEYETGDRGTGEPSRWANDRDLEWIELRPQLVAEVSFDHVSAGRIRHGAKFLRWRADKDPRDCTIDQLA